MKVVKIVKKFLNTRDNSHIYYEVIGHGEPLIFLHGNKQTTTYFKKQVAKFSRHYQLFLVNTRDHGLSSNTQDHLNFDLLTSDLTELLQNEKLKSANIVGFSDGANIALTFACRYPEKIKKLVLASPNLSPSHLKKSFYYLLQAGLKLAQSLSLKKISRVNQLALTPLPINKEQLAQLKRPVLVIAGSHDICPEESFHAIIKRLPLARLLIAKNTGHSVPRLRAKWFNEHVLSFLEDSFISKNKNEQSVF